MSRNIKTVKHREIIVLLALLFTSCLPSYSQLGVDRFLYGNLDLSTGNHVGFEIGGTYLIEEKYSFEVKLSTNVAKSRNSPEDYFSGLGSVLVLGLNRPLDYFNNYQLGIGRIWKFNEEGPWRFHLSGGVGLTTFRIPTNFEGVDFNFLIDNYDYEFHQYSTLSLYLSPKIELVYHSGAGLSISPILQLSKDRLYYGFSLGVMYGYLRKKKRLFPKDFR